MKNKQLIVIQGPTACGKTALSIALAEYFQTEIISADSRQFYSEMNIGTAKPSAEELQAVKHHFIGSESIHNLVTSAEFETRGLQILAELFTKHDTVVLVGGSGMFVDALVNGLDEVPTDENVKKELTTRFENEGLEKLAQELVLCDMSAESTVDLKNPVRVIRALEVMLITGKPFSSFKSQKPKKRPFEVVRFAINLPRETLCERINQRVGLMLEQGLWNEVLTLYPYKELKALQTVGYQEFFDHLDGKISFDEAVGLVKRNSRRYAKRQLTWLRRTQGITWLSGQHTSEQINEILAVLS